MRFRGVSTFPWKSVVEICPKHRKSTTTSQTTFCKQHTIINYTTWITQNISFSFFCKFWEKVSNREKNTKRAETRKRRQRESKTSKTIPSAIEMGQLKWDNWNGFGSRRQVIWFEAPSTCGAGTTLHPVPISTDPIGYSKESFGIAYGFCCSLSVAFSVFLLILCFSLSLKKKVKFIKISVSGQTINSNRLLWLVWCPEK